MKHVTHEWSGEPHASESVKRVDGVEVARNLVSNPLYKNNLAEWTISSATTELVPRGELFTSMGNLVGDEVLSITRTGSSNGNIRDNNLNVYDRDNWIAVSVPGQGRGLRIWLYFDDANNSTISFRQTSSLSYPNGGMVTLDAEIPRGTARTRLLIGGLSTGSETVYYGNPIATSAATEADALAQAETYFDGDTEDYFTMPLFKVRANGAWHPVAPKAFLGGAFRDS